MGLRESEEKVGGQLAKIKAIHRSAPVGLCFFDKNFRYLPINNGRVSQSQSTAMPVHVARNILDLFRRAIIVNRIGSSDRCSA